VPVHAGYLPSYWIKLRLLRAPAINSTIAQHYPVSTATHHVATGIHYLETN